MMPKSKRPPRIRTGTIRQPIQPFSLILQPAELSLLRKLARREGTSVAGIVRRAIHTVIGRVYPEFQGQMLESEANTFLDELATRYPRKMLSPPKRSTFKKQWSRV
jgi:hypothetical protein